MDTTIEMLINEATAFIRGRFSKLDWKGAAAILCDDGEILVSVAPESVNDAVSLCHETGAICEAYKRNKKVTLSVCVSYDDRGVLHILSPCGVCQERLWYWGENVQVGVPMADDSRIAKVRTLAEVSPNYWRRPFMKTNGLGDFTET